METKTYLVLDDLRPHFLLAKYSKCERIVVEEDLYICRKSFNCGGYFEVEKNPCSTGPDKIEFNIIIAFSSDGRKLCFYFDISGLVQHEFFPG